MNSKSKTATDCATVGEGFERLAMAWCHVANIWFTIGFSRPAMASSVKIT
jgi:aspartyl/asparaginyl-tRNA synthetase